jgi:hypothetical protein
MKRIALLTLVLSGCARQAIIAPAPQPRATTATSTAIPPGPAWASFGTPNTGKTPVQQPFLLSQPVDVTNSPFAPPSPFFIGYLHGNSPGTFFTLDPAGTISLDTSQQYPFLKSVGVPCPNCLLYPEVLGVGLNGIAVEGHFRISVDTGIFEMRVAAPSGPGPCLMSDPKGGPVYPFAVKDGFRYECDSDGMWGRIPLQKVW